jgi:UDP-3-O-[3-hydroxymyristoyl] glucosamine N-acyltransferase
MEATLGQLAALVDGQLHGDGDLAIRGAAPPCDAAVGDITMLDRADRQSCLTSCSASAILGPADLTPNGRPLIRVDDVHAAFATIINHLRPSKATTARQVSPEATVGAGVELGQDVDIRPGAVLGEGVTIGDRVTIHSGVQIMAGCRIGDDVTIFPGAVLYEETKVGPRCILHAGAVIGAYGFGYDSATGVHQLSAQLGDVVLEADVEVGANSAIDRGTYGSTLIGEGTKIDNLVQVAHNCRIGRHNLLCAQVGIAGSTTTGDYVVMAGQVGVRDHVHIGTGAILGAMAGIISDIPSKGQFVGIPATPVREQAVKQAALAKLPEMRKQLKKLERTVEELSRQVAESAPTEDVC